MKFINNPILRGFNPDPSILRVNDDYYIATSTFEWFPGIQIHHSRDLIHYKLITHPLNRISQLDMRGNPNSGGVWAPGLSYCDGLFYLVYTDVKAYEGIFKDTCNYLVTAKDIKGEWSEPVFLNSSGFDPSLFHDDDGRKWLVNMTWDHRKGRNPFGGILLQEYSEEKKGLVGCPVNIFNGTGLGLTEGPHIFKRNGYYYLVTAEGGTEFSHAVTMARSKSLSGPYEVDPENPVLTSRADFTLELKSSGHADIVETQNGDWYMVHLCRRPLPSKGRSILGRETSIQKMKWTEDNWLRLEAGGNKPQLRVPAPGLPEYLHEEEPARDDFDSETINVNFQTLRVPLSEDSFSLRERPGYLRLKGRESLISLHNQSMVARRQQAFCYTASACVEFAPDTFRQMAGLICIYDTNNFYYLYISNEDESGKSIGILKCDNGSFEYPLDSGASAAGIHRVYLKVEVNYERLQFFYSMDERKWEKLGPIFDASILSDEYCGGSRQIHFTGAFVGICCQDLSGMRKPADFDWFEYREDKFQGDGF